MSQILILHPIDKYFYLIGGIFVFVSITFLAPIAFCCTLFIMVTFFLYPKTRKLPGDLVFCISISECILSMHWFSFAVYNMYHDTSPLSDSDFCQVNAFVANMAGTGEFVYNIAFCIYLRITLGEVLRINKKIRLILHSLCLVVVIAIPVGALLTDSSGLNLYGTCSIKQKSSFPLMGVILLFIYIIISSYTIIFFKQTVPDNETYLL